MRILHLMLANYFVDGQGYQENILPLQNFKDGHEVKIVASTQTFINNEVLGFVQPSEYLTEDGIRVIRVPYRRILPRFIMAKIRSYPNVYNLIKHFKPDVILHHGVTAFELLTLAKYKRHNPDVKIYLDAHESHLNSARNLFSKIVLHKSFYAPILKTVLNQIDKILCTTHESIDFLEHFYGVPREKLEFYPLGGSLFPKEKYDLRRNRLRQSLGLDINSILMVHTGKMSKLKRTIDLLQAFSQVKSQKFTLLLLGHLPFDVKVNADEIIENDSRIIYLGWKKWEELLDYLCAADVYLQPGSPSATMQSAICCGCAVMLAPRRTNEPFLDGNGFYVKSIEDMIKVFKEIECNPEILKSMSEASFIIANNLLDYKKLAARLYQ